MTKRCFLAFVLLPLILAVAASADELCSFSGEIDPTTKQVTLRSDFAEGGTVSFLITFPAEGRMSVNAVIENLTTPLFDISTELNVQMESAADQKSSITGSLVSQYSLVNHLPVRDLNGTFQMRDGRLSLEHFSMGDIAGRGIVDLFYPYRIDMTFHLAEMPMKDFLSFWMQNDVDIYAEGTVSGRIQAAGSVNRLVLKGSLSSFNGVVDELEYDSIVLNAEGVYPVINIRDSVVTPVDALSFKIAGSVDLAQKDKFENQIKALDKSPLIAESENLLEWTIKQKKTEGTSGKTELKYLRRKGTSEGPSKEESDMFGIERSIEF